MTTEEWKWNKNRCLKLKDVCDLQGIDSTLEHKVSTCCHLTRNEVTFNTATKVCRVFIVIHIMVTNCGCTLQLHTTVTYDSYTLWLHTMVTHYGYILRLHTTFIHTVMVWSSSNNFIVREISGTIYRLVAYYSRSKTWIALDWWAVKTTVHLSTSALEEATIVPNEKLWVLQLQQEDWI